MYEGKVLMDMASFSLFKKYAFYHIHVGVGVEENARE